MKTILIIIGVILLVLLGAYFFFGRDKKSEEEAQNTLPPSVQRLVPRSWTVIQQKTCDFDSDGQDEWLVIYKYDPVNVQPTNQPAETYVTVNPIGAAIYDARLETPSQSGSSQYPVTSITPYKLLPDYAPGKGQGYLGESAVQLVLFPTPGEDEKCQPQEIGFFGYSGGYSNDSAGLPSRFSVFHWDGRSQSYQGSLLIGNARVNLTMPTKPEEFITQATTYHLLNDRSLLCQEMTYQRAGAKQAFSVIPGSTMLNFCYGAPGDPTYPEGAVAALLTGSTPHAPNANTQMPPGDSFLLPGVPPPAGLNVPTAILAIANTDAAETSPDGGHSCVTEYGSAWAQWWCGQFNAIVTTEVPVAGVVREVAWRLTSVSLNNVVGEVHWRIANVEPR